MSTDYVPYNMIPFDDLKETEGRKGRGLGFHVVHVSDVPPESREGYGADSVALTDGVNYLWASRSGKLATSFVRYGANDVDGILDALGGLYDTEFANDHDDDFWRLLNAQARRKTTRRTKYVPGAKPKAGPRGGREAKATIRGMLGKLR